MMGKERPKIFLPICEDSLPPFLSLPLQMHLRSLKKRGISEWGGGGNPSEALFCTYLSPWFPILRSEKSKRIQVEKIVIRDASVRNYEKCPLVVIVLRERKEVVHCLKWNAREEKEGMTKGKKGMKWWICFRPFEWLILFMICANCIALAVYQPYPAQDSDLKNNILVRFFHFIFSANGSKKEKEKRMD